MKPQKNSYLIYERGGSTMSFQELERFTYSAHREDQYANLHRFVAEIRSAGCSHFWIDRDFLTLGKNWPNKIHCAVPLISSKPPRPKIDYHLLNQWGLVCLYVPMTAEAHDELDDFYSAATKDCGLPVGTRKGYAKITL